MASQVELSLGDKMKKFAVVVNGIVANIIVGVEPEVVAATQMTIKN
jgi:hypothetical protein